MAGRVPFESLDKNAQRPLGTPTKGFSTAPPQAPTPNKGQLPKPRPPTPRQSPPPPGAEPPAAPVLAPPPPVRSPPATPPPAPQPNSPADGTPPGRAALPAPALPPFAAEAAGEPTPAGPRPGRPAGPPRCGEFAMAIPAISVEPPTPGQQSAPQCALRQAPEQPLQAPLRKALPRKPLMHKEPRKLAPPGAALAPPNFGGIRGRRSLSPPCPAAPRPVAAPDDGAIRVRVGRRASTPPPPPAASRLALESPCQADLGALVRIVQPECNTAHLAALGVPRGRSAACSPGAAHVGRRAATPPPPPPSALSTSPPPAGRSSSGGSTGSSGTADSDCWLQRGGDCFARQAAVLRKDEVRRVAAMLAATASGERAPHGLQTPSCPRGRGMTSFSGRRQPVIGQPSRAQAAACHHRRQCLTPPQPQLLQTGPSSLQATEAPAPAATAAVRPRPLEAPAVAVRSQSLPTHSPGDAGSRNDAVSRLERVAARLDAMAGKRSSPSRPSDSLCFAP
eukprot:TRINITY_DN10507_c0_g1_i1.p1 TRINITY_DN10507_c0_g1~~TRINITY_DN10507_c0_g1_i1.p1  ORF type:complete len:532 (+),score=63.08 TRINITY_DN10507_c0_g1_i1:77-1597(+)